MLRMGQWVWSAVGADMRPSSDAAFICRRGPFARRVQCSVPRSKVREAPRRPEGPAKSSPGPASTAPTLGDGVRAGNRLSWLSTPQDFEWRSDPPCGVRADRQDASPQIQVGFAYMVEHIVDATEPRGRVDIHVGAARCRPMSS